MPEEKKEYLGDGVYIKNDGYHLVLTAENGICATDTIYLDSYVLSALLKYVKENTAAS